MDKYSKSKVHKGLESFLDPGEASAIRLASEIGDCLLIIDEIKGRQIARRLNIAITGSLGILLTAKNKGVITSVKPILNKIQGTNFRLSDELIEKVLLLSNERKDT